MPWFVPLLAVIGIGITLVYGAYTDYKERIIPNMVPGLILLFGIFTATPWATKLASAGIMVVALVILSRVAKYKSGGGDIKLYCTLSFAVGPYALATLLVTMVLELLHRHLIQRRKREKGERIPLCTYLAPAYWLVVIVPMLRSLG